jgi:hypothetical protein
LGATPTEPAKVMSAKDFRIFWRCPLTTGLKRAV